MTYDQIKAKLLRENRLLEIAQYLQTSEEPTYLADRHLLHSDRERIKGLDIAVRDLGILLGLDLLRDWTHAAEEIRWLFISKPYLSIDGDWLAGVKNAAPPSVVVHLAKSAGEFRSMKQPRALAKKPDFDVSPAADFSGLDCLCFERAFDEEEPPGYTWCFRVRNDRFP